MSEDAKPLGRKAYGSIGHLPNSRMGPGDHHITDGQAIICTQDAGHRRVFVQTKLDGSCVAVAKIGREIVPLIRAGYRAIDSRRAMHHAFHAWAMDCAWLFDTLLEDGERVVGEWLAVAHGTRYDLTLRPPFVAFDIMREATRTPTLTTLYRLKELGFATPDTIPGPVDPELAMTALNDYGAHPEDGPEGVVYRVESTKRGATRVDFLAKWVRPDKVDGKYLSDDDELWNLPIA